MSSSAGGAGAGGGGLDITSLLDKAKELDQLKKDQDEVVAEINKIHKKILQCKLLSLTLAAATPPPPPYRFLFHLSALTFSSID